MKRTVLHALAVMLVSMGVYLGTLDASFVYDDVVYIVHNPQLEEPGDLFSTPFPAYMGKQRGLYRPMTTASLALDYWIFGLEPWGFHLTNIILHGLCALIFYFILRKIIDGSVAPMLGALLFGLHPARSEAVAWAVGRSELLAALGTLLSLYLYMGMAKGRRTPLVILGALAAFAFAGLSKENALAAPGIFFAYELFMRRGDPWRLRLLRLSPFAVVILLILLARMYALDAFSPQEGQQVLAGVVFPERLLLACWALSRYVLLVVCPFHLKPHYRPLEFTEAGPMDYVPALLFIAASLAAFRLSRRFSFCACLFLIPLVPVLNLVPIGEVLAERFLYLPMAGAGLAFGLLAARWIQGRFSRPGTALAALLLAGFGFMTVRQVDVWTDHYSLWSHAVAVDPANPQAHLGLGVALIRKGHLEGEGSALEELKTAQALNPNYKPELVAYNLGRVYEGLDRFEEAMKHYQDAIRHNPFYTLALQGALDLDRRLREEGREGLLSEDLRKAYSRPPQYR
jgi:tetratricopeptide (TPR) repeat protein